MMRHPTPIGPAPEGWLFRPGQCERVIPHTECSEEYQNDGMNSDHYDHP